MRISNNGRPWGFPISFGRMGWGRGGGAEGIEGVERTWENIPGRSPINK